MYNPQTRIFAPVETGGHRVETPPAPVVAKRVNSKRKKTVVAHIVTFNEFQTELGDAASECKTVLQLCGVLESRSTMVALGCGKSPEQASKMAATFGTGNLLVYVLSGCSDLDPQYLAVGVTSGCETAGPEMRGQWTVLQVFDGSFTRAAIEYAANPAYYAHKFNDLFRWSAHPSKKPLSSYFKKQQFVKVFPKVWDIYDGILAARKESRELEYTFETRLVLLLELLFNCGEVSRPAFLQRGGL